MNYLDRISYLADIKPSALKTKRTVYPAPLARPSHKHCVVISKFKGRSSSCMFAHEGDSFPIPREEVIAELLHGDLENVEIIYELDLLDGTCRDVSQEIADDEPNYSDPYEEHRLTARELSVGRYFP